MSALPFFFFLPTSLVIGDVSASAYKKAILAFPGTKQTGNRNSGTFGIAELCGMKNRRIPPFRSSHRVSCFVWHKVNDSVNRRVRKINEDRRAMGRNVG